MLKAIGKEDEALREQELNLEEKAELSDSIKSAARLNFQKLESVTSNSAFKPHLPEQGTGSRAPNIIKPIPIRTYGFPGTQHSFLGQ